VFQRIAQQVLEYLHTPHDVDLPANRQLLAASRQVKEQELQEGSPDRLGDSLEVADAGDPLSSSPSQSTKPDPGVAPPGVVPAAMRRPVSVSETPAMSEAQTSSPDLPVVGHPSGTVVVDAEQGGVVVPSFLGKTVRSAISLAEESSLDLEAVGSGLGQGQSPQAGTRVPAGSHVTVRFGR